MWTVPLSFVGVKSNDCPFKMKATTTRKMASILNLTDSAYYPCFRSEQISSNSNSRGSGAERVFCRMGLFSSKKLSYFREPDPDKLLHEVLIRMRIIHPDAYNLLLSRLQSIHHLCRGMFGGFYRIRMYYYMFNKIGQCFLNTQFILFERKKLWSGSGVVPIRQNNPDPKGRILHIRKHNVPIRTKGRITWIRNVEIVGSVKQNDPNPG